MDQFHSFSMRGRFCSAPWQNWDTALTPRGNLPTGKRHWIDSKAETHGRIANLSGEQWGAQRSNSCSNPALGRHLGAHALRTIQAQVLHGIIAKWRASKSQGTCRNWISTYRSGHACFTLGLLYYAVCSSRSGHSCFNLSLLFGACSSKLSTSTKRTKQFLLF